MSGRKGSVNSEDLSQLNLNAAGIDVGATSHYVAVPADRAEQPVQEFEAFTTDLYRLADWLAECGVETVVMESTGVYWIPLFGVLEERGFQVMLVDPRRIKNVPGRKTDVLDCQWLQQLHTYGLLSGAFRPEGEIRRLRSYLRQRAMLVQYASQHIQHMQKALTQMNVKLQHVISDITGKTGMEIIEAIVGGNGTREAGATARPQDQGRRGDHRQVVAGPLAGGAHLRADPSPWNCTRCIRIRLRSATGKSKPIWPDLKTAVAANLQRRGPGGASKETRPASMFGRTCIG